MSSSNPMIKAGLVGGSELVKLKNYGTLQNRSQTPSFGLCRSRTRVVFIRSHDVDWNHAVARHRGRRWARYRHAVGDWLPVLGKLAIRHG